MICWLMLIPALSAGQHYSSLRVKKITVTHDTIVLDTLSIAPQTVLITTLGGDTIDSALYDVNYFNATLLFQSPDLYEDSVYHIQYRVFPVLLTKKYASATLLKIEEDIVKARPSYIYQYRETKKSSNDGVFDFGELNRSGSISRGISVGNNQDAVLNSNLNLQLSGELAPGIEIVAAITDNNIPIQPEGTTQQLQEFDQVYIKINTASSTLLAGDFEISNSDGRFLHFNKKAQGVNFLHRYRVGKEDQWTMSSQAGAAASRGKFARNTIETAEGNQGPYKLRGANNESFVIILAGSERVFLDGKLLKRGQNYDYVIDYNSAEITFTPQQIITKDARVVIEFEYSDRNYTRGLFFLSHNAVSKNANIRFRYLTEQDMKNRPINQEKLIEDNKTLLSNIGDQTDLAVVSNIREVDFNNSEVLYKMIDTTVFPNTYDSVLVYSVNPDSAMYRAGFSFVGKGNGNYVQTKSAANGKVFKWVVPVGGVPQGEYEPVVMIITPKSQQMVTLAGDFSLSEKSMAGAEIALSGFDKNKYSTIDNHDDLGIAFISYFKHKRRWGGEDSNTWLFDGSVSYDIVEKNFEAFERIRAVEFERDWNIDNTLHNKNIHHSEVILLLERKDKGRASYKFENLVSSDYSAIRNGIQSNFLHKTWRMEMDADLMNSFSEITNTGFLKYRARIEKQFGPLRIGFEDEGENNRHFNTATDTLMHHSLGYNRWKGYVSNADTATIPYTIGIGQRFDYLPENGMLMPALRADEVAVRLNTKNNNYQRLDVEANYRRVKLLGDNINEKEEQNLVSRINYDWRLKNGVIRSTTFYEFGSGLAYKKEFSYIEVATGQGVYAWNDYNGDSIKQLDEFEIAMFKDQANYIRVFTPVNEYEKVYSAKFTQSLILDPAPVWKKEKGLKGFAGNFSSHTIYRVDQEIAGESLLEAMNPFFLQTENPDLKNITASLRHVIYFNRTDAKYGADYTFRNNSNKSVMVNGFESRQFAQHILKARWNITSVIMLRVELAKGIKERYSEFFTQNDYAIEMLDVKPEISIQPGTKFRITGQYSYTSKENSFEYGGERATLNKANVELRFITPEKGNIMSSVAFISIDYNADQNNSIAFEMLEGLKQGNNLTWTVNWQRTLSNNLQLNLQYNGRKSPDHHAIHVGTVQVRAFF